MNLTQIVITILVVVVGVPFLGWSIYWLFTTQFEHYHCPVAADSVEQKQVDNDDQNGG